MNKPRPEFQLALVTPHECGITKPSEFTQIA